MDATTPSEYQSLLELLKSKNQHEVARAEQVFMRLGSVAALGLLFEARNRRFSIPNRLRFLRLARKVGVPFVKDACYLLQDLIEDRCSEVSLEACQIVVEISPDGEAGVFNLQLITLRPYFFKERQKQIRESLRKERKKVGR
jgi:hypothetical protein